MHIKHLVKVLIYRLLSILCENQNRLKTNTKLIMRYIEFSINIESVFLLHI